VILMLGCSASSSVSPDSAKTVESTTAAPAEKPAAPSTTQSVTAAAEKPAALLASEHRVALVIGNASYSASPLLNPVNDARAISEALQSMGFQVTRLENATSKQMSDAAREFGDTLRKGDVGLFFYAGHGMQIKGRNYLIPIGADIQREDEVPFNAFDAGLLLEKMETAHSRVNIVILDACRNNPFTAASTLSSSTPAATIRLHAASVRPARAWRKWMLRSARTCRLPPRRPGLRVTARMATGFTPSISSKRCACPGSRSRRFSSVSVST